MSELAREPLGASGPMADAPTGAPSIRNLLPTLVIDAALPAMLYRILSARGAPDVDALCAGAVFPIGHIIFGLVRTRRVDFIGVFVLLFIVLGSVASLLSHNVLFVLIKESVVTGVFGLVCLTSLLWNRPLMFYFGRQFAAGNDADRIQWWNNRWQFPAFRQALRMITVFWGLGYVFEAAVRVLLALRLKPGTVVIISPLMAIGTTVILALWTARYSRAGRERRLREAAMNAAANP
jgi:intracellular septation protein A